MENTLGLLVTASFLTGRMSSLFPLFKSKPQSQHDAQNYDTTLTSNYHKHNDNEHYNTLSSLGYISQLAIAEQLPVVE